MDTLICRSFQSFIDFCDNEVVEGRNVHCTFKTDKNKDWAWMRSYLEEKGGRLITFSSVCHSRLEHKIETEMV